MPKCGEIDYFKNIGKKGQIHAFNKPFSDPKCGSYLCDLGAIFTLLPQPPAKLLDLGVGTGWTSIFFAQRGYDVVGQDICSDAISLAYKNKERYLLDNVSFAVSDYEEMKYTNEFDCAVFYDSLHHSVDEKEALQAVYNALKPGGICITLEPGINHAKSPDAKQAVKTYNVNERSMHPKVIINAGKGSGFRKFRIYSRPNKPLELSRFLVGNGILDLFKRVIKLVPIISLRVGNIVVMQK